MIYRLTRLATSHRGGVNQAIDAEIRGVAKTNARAPYTIANEVVAARLGQSLGVPVPAGVVAEHSGDLYYLSLDVSKEGKALPPIIPADFVIDEPLLAAGAVVFDIWILNSDRHGGNISYDRAFTPPRASFFDHGHALLGADATQGEKRFEDAEDDLGCTGKPPLSGNRHVLLDLVASAADLRTWVERVEQLASFIVEDACGTARDLGLLPKDSERDALQEGLLRRKSSLSQLLSDHQEEFPAVMQWDLEGSP